MFESTLSAIKYIAFYAVIFFIVPTAAISQPVPRTHSFVEEMDYRSACKRLSDETFGKIEFDGKHCRCQFNAGAINPFRDSDKESCVLQTTLADICKSGGERTRYVINDGPGFQQGCCFCVATAQFMERYSHSEERLAKEVNECLRGQTPIWPSSYQVGTLLSHYLSGLPKGVEPLVDLKSLQSIFHFLHPTQSSRSVKVVGHKMGIHGGKVFVYRLKWNHADWMNYDDPVGQQLDPTESTRRLERFVGRFFGFEQIDKHTYTIPSLDEYLRAIKAVNQNEKVISGTAYEVVGQFGQKEYIENFIREGALPASEFLPSGDQTYFFHDMALHLASNVMYAPELFKSLQLFAQTRRLALEKTGNGQSLVATMIDGLSVAPLLFPHEIPAKEIEEVNDGMSVMFTAGQQKIGMLDSVLGSYDTAEATKTLSSIPVDPHFVELEKQMASAPINATRYVERFRYLGEQHMKRLTSTIEKIIGQCKREL